MDKVNSTSLLSAFATIKSLVDAKEYESPYQILAEFIRYIIAKKSLHSFGSLEMKNLLNEYFGFEIPESVVKTAAKGMKEVVLEDRVYTVVAFEKEDTLFSGKKQEAEDTSSNLINTLVTYVQDRAADKVILKDVLAKELIAFLVDDQQSSSDYYTDLIGRFILEHEYDEDIQAQLKQIREGSILYIGLNYNIGETGSITKPLTIYLGTEILFSIAGYNGEIFKKLTDDFLRQVRAVNIKSKEKITLRYFSAVKKEIEDFFFAAEMVVEGKKAQLVDKPAMMFITNGCTTASDVKVRKSDFYHNLEFGFGIKEDPFNNYYDESQFESNLESFDYIDEEDKKKKRERGIKYISNINKLRGGKYFSNDIESEFILVTNTKATLLISQEQTERIKSETGCEYVSNFAISLDRITSLLWYKLGNGFGKKDFPANVDAVLRARIILSSSIAKRAERAYFDAKKDYEAGVITADQLAGRIITLRVKPKLPEELQGDSIGEIMDFSLDYLNRYEEKAKQDRKVIEEKDALISVINSESKDKDKTISAQKAIISEQKAVLSEKDNKIESQNLLIEEQRGELETYRRREEDKRKKRNKIKVIFKFLLNIIWKMVIVAVICMAVATMLKRFANFSSITSNTLGIVGALFGIGAFVFKDYKKYFPDK